MPAFPLSETYHDVNEYLVWLATEKHEFKTLVIDSLDWLETLIWNFVIVEYNESTGKKITEISQIGYGEGYKLALEQWNKLIARLNYIRDNLGMTIILTAHSTVATVTDPLQPSYDRHTIKLHKYAAAKIVEFCDIVLYCTWQLTMKSEDEKFGGSRKRAISTGERIMHTVGSPTVSAKNRYSLPNPLPLDWNTLNDAIQNSKKSKGK